MTLTCYALNVLINDFLPKCKTDIKAIIHILKELERCFFRIFFQHLKDSID